MGGGGGAVEGGGVAKAPFSQSAAFYANAGER